MPAPIRSAARPAARQRGSAFAQLAILLASVGFVALAVLQIVRH